MVMKSYLQRLAARATGHTVASSLRPIVRSSMSSESDADPFAAGLESHELPGAQSSRAYGSQAMSTDPQVTTSLQSSSEPGAPSAPLAAASRSRPRKRSHAEQTPEPAVEAQSISSESAVEKRPSSTEIDFQATPENEPRKSADKSRVRANPAKTQTTDLEQNNQRIPPGMDEVKNPTEPHPLEHVRAPRTRLDHGAEPFAAETQTGDEGDADASNRLARDMSLQTAPRKEDTVESTHASSRVIRTDLANELAPLPEPGLVDAIRTAIQFSGSSQETAQTLEPRAAAVAPAAQIPDEPRLVIGQLRVDVVAAPAQPREVVRVMTRTIGPGRSSNAGGSLSKLRFGLGQM
jgi:hypothetical protein